MATLSVRFVAARRPACTCLASSTLLPTIADLGETITLMALSLATRNLADLQAMSTTSRSSPMMSWAMSSTKHRGPADGNMMCMLSRIG